MTHCSNAECTITTRFVVVNLIYSVLTRHFVLFKFEFRSSWKIFLCTRCYLTNLKHITEVVGAAIKSFVPPIVPFANLRYCMKSFPRNCTNILFCTANRRTAHPYHRLIWMINYPIRWLLYFINVVSVYPPTSHNPKCKIFFFYIWKFPLELFFRAL